MTEQLQTSRRVLIVDDERAIREMVCLALSSEGFQCLEASDAHKAEVVLREQPPDIILLDWMMPGISGVDFARSLRRKEKIRDIPIIMLTARAEEEDMIRGLDSGVDDYLTKPFSTRELLARIRSLLRRIDGHAENTMLQAGRLQLDLLAHRVSCQGNMIDLGPTEFRLLKFFMENQERVYSREQVLNHVWGNNVYVEERTVDVHIRRLRKALEPCSHDQLVQTVRGAGYRFSAVR